MGFVTICLATHPHPVLPLEGEGDKLAPVHASMQNY